MSEFKPGDRVTHIDPYFSETYVVADDGGGAYVNATAPDGAAYHFQRENLKLVEPEKPAVGDRVRVTYEGVVEVIDYGLHVRTDDNRSVYVGRANHELEILERKKPEPYPVGTLYYSGGLKAVRLQRGKWRWLHSDSVSDILTDELIRNDRVGSPEVSVHEPPTS